MEKLYKDKEWLEEQYIIEKNSMEEIAKMCKCSGETIRYWIIKHGIERRTTKEAMSTERTRHKMSETHKGKQFSNETRKKMSDAKKGEKNPFYGKHHIKETIKKISESKKGEKNPMYGKHHSDETRKKMSDVILKRKQELGYLNSPETRQKISESMKGKHHSEETRQKIGMAGKGRKHTEETKKNMSESQKGENNSFYGKKHTKESKQKNREKLKEMYKNGEIEKMIGIKNPNWNPNRAEVYAPYGEKFYNKQLRYKRWNLQNGRDLLTGEKLEYGFKSHYHHIDWNKSNDDPNNIVWLNSSTHGKVHSKRKRKYYETILKSNLQALKEGKIPKTWTKKNTEMFRQENLVQLKLPINQIIEKEWCYGY